MLPDTLQVVANNQNSGASLDFVVRITTLIISAINLWLVYHIFSSNRRFNRGAILIEKQCIWFRQLALEPNRDKIDAFYENSLRILEEGKKEIVTQIKTTNKHDEIIKLSLSTVGKFNEGISDLDKDFVDILRVINPVFGDKIARLFDVLQDKINPKFDELVSKGEKCECKFSEALREHKRDLFKELYNYEIAGLLSPITEEKI